MNHMAYAAGSKRVEPICFNVCMMHCYLIIEYQTTVPTGSTKRIGNIDSFRQDGLEKRFRWKKNERTFPPIQP
jgi:hypothetical protein